MQNASHARHAATQPPRTSSVSLVLDAGHGHAKLKHVARRHMYVRELMTEGKINVSFIRTDYNVADLFTKPRRRDACDMK